MIISSKPDRFLKPVGFVVLKKWSKKAFKMNIKIISQYLK